MARLLPGALAHAQAEAALSARARHKLSIIRWYEGHGRNASLTCRHFGYSRSTFHLWLRRYQQEGPRGLEDRSRRPHRVRQPTWSQELAQADTADIRFLPGVVYKHFTGRDVVSRWDVLDVYQRATGQAAASLLDALLERAPFPVKAIQVDGGSEFRAQFEEACQKRGIRLFVLPPRSPKPACRQAGSTGTWSGPSAPPRRTETRREFYQVIDPPDTLTELRERLRAQEAVYNTIQPHQALGQRTPREFCQEWLAAQTERR